MPSDSPSPSPAHPLFMQGLALHRAGQMAEAEQCYRQALALEPRHADALHMLGVLAAQHRQPQQAVQWIGQAVEIDPRNAEAYNNLAVSLRELGQIDLALRCYEQAIALKPDYPDAYYNLAILLEHLGQYEVAIQCYEKAVALRPDWVDAHGNLSVCLLLTGQFEQGWREYEWRWHTRGFSTPKRDFGKPQWTGREPLAGKTILLYSEQGLGDALQFSRYIPLVAARGARVVLEVQRPLLSLFRQRCDVADVIAWGAPLSRFDFHCPLMSLPLAFATRPDNVPAPGFTRPGDQDKADHWRRRLGPRQKPRVGLAWQGSRTHYNDHNRSLPLAALAPLLADARVQFVCLQKDLAEADRQLLANQPGVLNLADELEDFADTAAVCEALDLVVSVDTSVAHLAGTVGTPTWVLLPFRPEWRWLLERTDSPWYPRARLYRQAGEGDWAGVIERVRADLGTL